MGERNEFHIVHYRSVLDTVMKDPCLMSHCQFKFLSSSLPISAHHFIKIIIFYIIVIFLQFLLDALQEGLPVRLKGIHVLNTAAFVDHLMRLIKPFLSKELQKLVC